MNRHFSNTSSWADGHALRPSARPRIDFYKLSVPSVPSVPVYYSYRNYRPYSHYSKLGGTYRIDMCRLSGRLVPPIYVIGAA
jgi:hypothetical protein